jgi:VIT1/CCC1 family predicted Fe2+/Mn2+ transporter
VKFGALDPMDRISEVLFGVIMALTFTGALSVATASSAEVRTMLIGALGCNLAWGIIDAGIYVMAQLNERGRAILAARDQGLPQPMSLRLTTEDARGAVSIFLIVFLSTFPLVIPFIFIHDARTALRVSNGVAIAILFGCGYVYGRRTGLRPVLTGLVMVVVGGALVAVAIAFGG